MQIKCLYVPTLETERLLLRELVPDDAEDLGRWLGSDELYTYRGRKASKAEKDPALLFEDPRPNVKRKPSHDFTWGIVLGETNRVIGILEIFDVENDRMGMVGYRISPAYWGRGLCTEALRRAVVFIFSVTQLDRLQGNADVRNTASNRVLQKCGFKLEGTIRHGKMVSCYCDFNIWGLIRDDLTDESDKTI
jgi:ribosomal-protein-alanine N-acetyltransferase